VTLERNPGPPPEAHQPPLAADPIVGTATPSGGLTPVQIRLQILSTEHWSLLASRSLAWNESFARAGMFLSTLSGAMVALALVAGLDKTGDAFFLFAIVLLPIVLFIGLATLLRLGAANRHDAICVIGMNRIRGAYLELAPELAPYFVMSPHDDPRGMHVTQVVPSNLGNWQFIAASTPFLVTVINAVVAAAIAATIALRIDALPGASLGLALVVFAVFMFTQARISRRNMLRVQSELRPMFPTPPDDWSGA
jgi:hypothetical protein